MIYNGFLFLLLLLSNISFFPDFGVMKELQIKIKSNSGLLLNLLVVREI